MERITVPSGSAALAPFNRLRRMVNITESLRKLNPTLTDRTEQSMIHKERSFL